MDDLLTAGWQRVYVTLCSLVIAMATDIMLLVLLHQKNISGNNVNWNAERNEYISLFTVNIKITIC